LYSLQVKATVSLLEKVAVASCFTLRVHKQFVRTLLGVLGSWLLLQHTTNGIAFGDESSCLVRGSAYLS
ncbi:hypothetical protein, partial [Nonlabens sp.]|uniref:hypothetical protein n=1 Tax=Nonlabens sp. TaxID=1888209 RepID=UPI0025D6FF1A